MDVHDIAKAILEDKAMTFDDVDLLMSVLQTKRKRISAAQPLKTGDRVRLRNIKPKYLDGAEGMVMGRANTKIKVRLDQQLGRYGQELKVPRTALEKIGPKEEG
jgi:hypothetical protein